MKFDYSKILILALIVVLGLVISFAINSRLFAVALEISDTLIVTPTAVPLGTVFPGEQRGYDFNVSLSEFFQKLQPFTTVFYKVTEQAPTSTLSLCNFTTQNPSPGEGAEGDGVALAKLNTNLVDISDNWQGQLRVPALAGQAAQGNQNGITPAPGLHECDLVIAVTSQETNLPIPEIPRPPRPPRPPSPWPFICRVFPNFPKCAEFLP